MKTYKLHWLNKRGQEYGSTLIECKSHPAAIRRASRALSRTCEAPPRSGKMSPVAAYGFYVTEVQS